MTPDEPGRAGEVWEIVRRRVTEALVPRRADAGFAARLRERMAQDGPMLQRMAAPRLPCDRCDRPQTHLTRSGFRLCAEHAKQHPDATPYLSEPSS